MESQLKTKDKILLSDVNNTSLLTLFCRAVDSRRADRIIDDPMAVTIAERLIPIIAGSDDVLLRSLSRWKVDPQATVHIALRAAKFDQYARNFLASHPDGIIVNLGCGLDSRFHRLGDDKLEFFDLDLPEVIRLKRQLVEETDRYHLLAYSVLDFRWMDELSSFTHRPILFLAEGLFMYLKPEDVKGLVCELLVRFPGSELVCEVFNSAWLKGALGSLVHRKMRQRLNMGKKAQFLSGLAHPREMEEWDPRLRYVDDWSYFDTDHPRMRAYRVLGTIPFLRNIQYSVHYQLLAE